MQKSVLNFERHPLFIEVGMLRKINRMILYELRHILISKKLKRLGLISIQKSSGRASSLCQSALQECQMAFLGAEPTFEFWSNLDSFF